MKRKLTALVLTLTLVLSLLGTFFPAATPVSAQGADSGEVLPPLELPAKGNPKLDSQLNQLIDAQNHGETASFAKQSGIPLSVNEAQVIIEVTPGNRDAVTKAVESLGGKFETSYQDLVQVTMPINQLTALANTPGVLYVRLPEKFYPSMVGEGVPLINADDWQSAGFTGAGTKVAIIDAGFQGYTSLLGTELPSSVTAVSFRANGDITGGGQVHGTACTEIIHDIAPGAQLYLVNFGTTAELGNAVNYLIGQDVDIISFSMGASLGGPGDGTGTTNSIVDTARAAGILWVTAMGNEGQRHWQGNFVDANEDGFLEFSGTDWTNSISANNTQPIVVELKWADPWVTSSNDYDLYLLDSAGYIIAGSENTQDGVGGNDYPLEGLAYTANYTGSYHIVIRKYLAAIPVNFHLYTYYNNLQHPVASGSLTIPADSPNAMSVGAVPWNNPTSLEPFSSQGPTTDNRTKPDIVAPDGVSSVAYGHPFFGTSAATPYTAGAAALVKQRFSSYTPTQIQDYLEGKAVPLGATGKDNLFGSGRLDLGSLYNLNITVSGNGTVAPPPGTYTYDSGTVVSINATPAVGWQFVNWTGSVADHNSANTTVTMNGNKTVTANFSLPPISLEWSQTFGGSSNDAGSSVQQTTDGGYLVAGRISYYGTSNKDILLVKTDDSGNSTWGKTFGGVNYEEGYDAHQTADGGYVVVGYTTSYGSGGEDVYLVKTDSSGNMTWSQTFGGTGTEGGFSVQQTSDGGYIIVGQTDSFGAGLIDVYLIKTDSSGNMTWSKTFGGIYDDVGSSVQQTSDGGYIIAGETYHSSVAGSQDFYLVKTNSSGNLTWSQTFGGTNGETAYSVEQTSDGGFIITGYTISFGAGSDDVYLVKTDSSGNMTWSKTFGGVGDDWGHSVNQTTDGGYIIAGATTSFGAGSEDVYLIKTNSSGNVIWSQTFGDIGNDGASFIQQTSNGGFITTGYTSLYGVSPSDVWLLKLKVNVLAGDANGDGQLNALDITKVERIIVLLDSPTPGADANQDGKLNAVDITSIERKIAGLN